jgi:uncharacterized protein YecA (UPF0149 family)
MESFFDGPAKLVKICDVQKISGFLFALTSCNNAAVHFPWLNAIFIQEIQKYHDLTARV